MCTLNESNSHGPPLNPLIGTRIEGFIDDCARRGVGKLMGRAIWTHAHRRACTSLEQLFNELSVSERVAAAVREGWCEDMGAPEQVMSQLSTDGTSKWLLRFGDPGSISASPSGRAPVEIETVFIPEADSSPRSTGVDMIQGRGTVCVSSQAGCSLACTFCSTGRTALQRNLTPHEIVWQLLWVRRALGDLPPPPTLAAPRDAESGTSISLKSP